jgi:transposase-like protein
MSWLKKLFGAGTQNTEKFYNRGVELFGQDRFRDAAEVLEETARLNPNSAPVHFTLGATYSRIAGEYGNDEEKVRPWAKKSRDSFKNAVDLAPTSGGLNEKQLSIARDAVTAFDRITERDSPSLPEEQRRKIYADFMETHDTQFLLGTNLAREIGAAARSPGLGLGAMMQSINSSGQQADVATYAKIGRKYGLSEGQLRAIVGEGKQKKWPFKAVAR